MDYFGELKNLLKKLIQFNTVNPPGNELDALKFIREFLANHGVNSEIIKTDEKRGILFTRIKGKKNSEGLLLSSHIDVVPFNEKNWSVHPLSGVEKDGYIWGRGALDMKFMTAYNIMTTILVSKLEKKPERNLAMIVVSDEEAGCEKGSKWLVENRKDLIDEEYAFNELGGFTTYINGKKIYPIQVAEKGVLWLKVIFKGNGGHGSIPDYDSPIFKAAKFIDNIKTVNTPVHITEPVKEFVKNVSKVFKLPASFIFKLLLQKDLTDKIITFAIKDAQQKKLFNAMFRNTISPNIVKGGVKINVIPDKIELDLDCRVLPGYPLNRVFEEIENLLPDKSATIKVINYHEPSVVPSNSEIFKTIKETVLENEEDALVTPYMLTAYTDAGNYQKLGIKTYGFSPLKVKQGFEVTKLIHAAHERVPVDGLKWGFKVYRDVVLKWIFKDKNILRYF